MRGLSLHLMRGLSLHLMRGLSLHLMRGLPLDLMRGLPLDLMRGLPLDLMRGLPLDRRNLPLASQRKIGIVRGWSFARPGKRVAWDGAYRSMTKARHVSVAVLLVTLFT